MNREFLKSNRFWYLITAVICTYLSSKGIIGQDEIQVIDGLLGIMILVRTVDRFGEQKGKTN